MMSGHKVDIHGAEVAFWLRLASKEDKFEEQKKISDGGLANGQVHTDIWYMYDSIWNITIFFCD